MESKLKYNLEQAKEAALAQQQTDMNRELNQAKKNYQFQIDGLNASLQEQEKELTMKRKLEQEWKTKADSLSRELKEEKVNSYVIKGFF